MAKAPGLTDTAHHFVDVHKPYKRSRMYDHQYCRLAM